MITPTVNLNGTSCDNLLNDLEEAMIAINSACVALNICSPHGRDYPDGNLQAAIKEHQTRLNIIASIGQELEVLSESVYKQRK